MEAQAKIRIDAMRAEAEAHIKTQGDKIRSETEARATKEIEQAKTDADTRAKAQVEAAVEQSQKQVNEYKLGLAKAVNAVRGKEAEAKRNTDELSKSRATASQLSALNSELNSRMDTVSKENRGLKDQIHNINAARATAGSGFVVWRGSGKGRVSITDHDNKGLEGALPAGPCLIEDVFGEHIDRKSARGASCREFSFVVTKNSATTAYILWRTGLR